MNVKIFYLSFIVLVAGSCNTNKDDDPGTENPCEVVDELADIPGWHESEHSTTYQFGPVPRFRFLDKNNGYALGTTLIKTSDGGKTWYDVAGFPRPSGNMSRIELVDAQNIYVVADHFSEDETSPQVLVRSNDGGQTWETIPISGWIIGELSFLNAMQGFAFGFDLNGSGPTLIRSIDGGESWTLVEGVAFPSPYSSLLIDWRTSSVGMAQAGREKAYLTTDGGLTWNVIPNEPQTPGHFYLINENTLFLSGYDQSAVTNDGGITWIPTDPARVFALAIDNESGLGVVLYPDCPTADPEAMAYATSIDGGETWTFTQLSSANYSFNQQEVTPGLVVNFNLAENIFTWFEKE